MATQAASGSRAVTNNGAHSQRLSTETKASFKTSELIAYVAVLIGILVAGNSIGTENGNDDVFRADKVWLYATILTIGYMISRGLAKSGSREPYWAGGSNEDRDNH